MNEFDQAARFAAKLDPPGFLRWLLSSLDPALTFRDWLDTRTIPFPGEPDRTCDTVAGYTSAAEPEQPWAVVVEFQSKPHRDMLDRLLEYLARLRRELRHGRKRRGKHRVAAALVNLTGRVQVDTLDMALPGMTGAGLRLQVVLRTLPAEDAAATLQAIAAGRVARCILPWIPLMHGGGDLAIIKKWKRIARRESDSLLRGAYAGLALVFAELAGCSALWKQALEGWNMGESKVIAEWRTEGKIEARRADLLRALKLRFQASVPADLVKAVRSLTDPDELSRWFDASQTTGSLEEFRAAVQS